MVGNERDLWNIEKQAGGEYAQGTLNLLVADAFSVAGSALRVAKEGAFNIASETAAMLPSLELVGAGSSKDVRSPRRASSDSLPAVDLWLPEGTPTKRNDGGTAYKNKDGSTTVLYVDGSRMFLDNQGDVQKVVTPTGITRTFRYVEHESKKVLAGLTETRQTRSGEKTQEWTREFNLQSGLSDQFVCSGADGSKSIRYYLAVLSNGDCKFYDQPLSERVAGRDGTYSGFSASKDEARDRLRQAIDAHLDRRSALRLEGFMKQFEKRTKDRVEAMLLAGMDKDVANQWDQKVVRTYDFLAEMMEQNPESAVHDKATRAKLVDNFLWLAADTTRDRQDVDNCWLMANRNFIGMTCNPDAMARMLKEVSLTATYTSLHGGLRDNYADQRPGDLDKPAFFNIPRSILEVKDRTERWSLDSMQATPVGCILDNVIGYMGGRGTHKHLSTGSYESNNAARSGLLIGYARNGREYGINELMYMITGERTPRPIGIESAKLDKESIKKLTSEELQSQLLKFGGALVISPGDPGHMWALKLVKRDDHWQIVSDNQWTPDWDETIAKVKNPRTWEHQLTREQYTPAISGEEALSSLLDAIELPIALAKKLKR
jgi:hypothetical protein